MNLEGTEEPSLMERGVALAAETYKFLSYHQ